MHLTSPDTKIYVAGHRGMVGRAVWRRLTEAGYTNLVGRTSGELDLRDPHATRHFFETEEPDFVVLAAARVGGILANDRYPADFLGDNLAIEQSVIQAAHETGVDRLIFLGSTCIYPKHAPQPMPEDSLLTGPLERPDGFARLDGVAPRRRGAIASMDGAERRWYLIQRSWWRDSGPSHGTSLPIGKKPTV